MARRVTKTAIRGLLSKGLTGREAGRLLLQHVIDRNVGKPPLLDKADFAAIRDAPMSDYDVRQYNRLVTVCEAFKYALPIVELACKDACLDMTYLLEPLRDIDRSSVAELFTSTGPRVVTRSQYEDIVAAQRRVKLDYDYSLAYVAEERFYAMAPREARCEIEQNGADTESAKAFMAAVPKKHNGVWRRAIEQIRELYVEGKLETTCCSEDTRKVTGLLARWRKGELSRAGVSKLLDLMFVKGQQLYDCAELPEWKVLVDRYQSAWFADEDERFGRTYAVLETCPDSWTDEAGCYRDPLPLSQFVTRPAECALGLHGRDKEPDVVDRAALVLRAILKCVESDIRTFFAVKTVFETALEAAEVPVPGGRGLFAHQGEWLGLYVDEYNRRLGEVKDGERPWRPVESMLQKAVKALPAIDLDTLKPTADCLAQLKGTILADAQDNDWLPTKLRSLVYADGLPPFVGPALMRGFHIPAIH